MFKAVDHPYLVSGDGKFRIKDSSTTPPEGTPGKKALKKELEDLVEELHDLQRYTVETIFP